MERRAFTVAAAALAGLLLFGVVWGLLVSALTLVGVVLLAGLAGQLLPGDRVHVGWIVPAGLAGAVLAIVAVGFLGLPPLIRVAGVPVIWAVIAATATVVAAGGVASDGEPRARP